MKSLFDLPGKFLSKIMPCPTTGCWLWTGATSSNGYGNCWHENRYQVAHRAVFGILLGRVPDGLTLDHLCRNRCCVNPLHLDPVTQKENNLRGNSLSAICARRTHCPVGHPLEGEHLYIEVNKKGVTHRHCRTCMHERLRRRRRKEEPYTLKKAAARAATP